MTETPGQAFRRVRKQRRDKMRWLATTIRGSTSHISYVELGKRSVPRRWLRILPPEYAEAIVPIWIAELQELLPAERERPRKGEQTGPLVRSRNTWRIPQTQDDAEAQARSIAFGRHLKPTAPQPIGCPPAVARYGESPEARAFRRFPPGRKL